MKTFLITSVMVLLLVLASIIWYCNWHAWYKNTLEPTPYYSGEFPEELTDIKYYDITQAEMRLLIEKEILSMYIYKVDDAKQYVWSEATSNWFIRTVWMRSDYDSVYDYGCALAHELIHIKHITVNEAWVEFETFKVLYNSEYKILHDLGKYCGLKILNLRYNDDYDTIGWQYDVSGHVIKYLEELS